MSTTKAAMRRYLSSCIAEGKEPAQFVVSPPVYQELSRDGSRPVSFEGLPVVIIDTWAWGWMLFQHTPEELVPYELPAVLPTDNVVPLRALTE